MKHIKLFEEFLGEGINDPGILKAFFMAGGPGSGKSYVAGEIFSLPKDSTASVSYELGLKLVNSDAAFELLLKKANIDMAELMDLKDKDPKAWDRAMAIRSKAKKISKGTQKMYIEGRLGMVIDGTGKNFKKIEGQVKELRELGYDCYMVFVNTSKEIALDRNNNRPRKLPVDMVTQMWQEVQDNLGKFQRLFKAKRFEIVDNSKYGDTQPTDFVGKEIRKFMGQSVSNPIGKQWIQDQKKKK
jgi:predicted kinase|tara:strand:- start:836 stop:1564 length:729 start_codon:yes stop_codon:yes gene_type:complete